MLKEAIKIWEAKGFCVENQFDGWLSTLPDAYELYRGSECVMDHLRF